MTVLFAQYSSSSSFGPANFIGIALWVLMVAGAIYTIVDLNKYPEWAWQQSGQNKGLWMGLLIGGAVVGCCCFVIGLVPIIIYFASIKKKLDAAQGGYGGASPFGPYAAPSAPGGYPAQPPGGYPPAAPGGYPPPAPGGYPPASGGYPPQPTDTNAYPPPTPADPGIAPTPSGPFDAPPPIPPVQPFEAPAPFEAPPVVPPVEETTPPPAAPSTEPVDTGSSTWSPPSAYQPADLDTPSTESPTDPGPPRDPDAPPAP